MFGHNSLNLVTNSQTAYSLIENPGCERLRTVPPLRQVVRLCRGCPASMGGVPGAC